MSNDPSNSTPNGAFSIFERIIETTNSLPAALAYGSTIVISILFSSVLGVVIPNNIAWLIGIIVLFSLAAFVFLTRRSEPPSPLPPLPENMVPFYVIVHQEGDPTNFVADAKVYLALPENPQSKSTSNSGFVRFNFLSEYVGKNVYINASKDGYKEREPLSFTVESNGHIFISLKPILTDDSTFNNTENRIKLLQLKPTIGEEYVGNTSLSLGRNGKSNITFPEETGISWDHGLIVFKQGGYFYEHLSNSSQTTIRCIDGSKKVFQPEEKDTFLLSNGDHLILKDYEFVVTFDIIGTDERPRTRT